MRRGGFPRLLLLLLRSVRAFRLRSSWARLAHGARSSPGPARLGNVFPPSMPTLVLQCGYAPLLAWVALFAGWDASPMREEALLAVMLSASNWADIQLGRAGWDASPKREEALMAGKLASVTRGTVASVTRGTVASPTLWQGRQPHPLARSPALPFGKVVQMHTVGKQSGDE